MKKSIKLFTIIISFATLIACSGNGGKKTNSTQQSEPQQQERVYSHWSECVSVELDKGSAGGGTRLYATNICDVKLKQVEVEYVIIGYGESSKKTTTFYGLRPNQTENKLLGMSDPNVVLKITDISVRLGK